MKKVGKLIWKFSLVLALLLILFVVNFILDLFDVNPVTFCLSSLKTIKYLNEHYPDRQYRVRQVDNDYIPSRRKTITVDYIENGKKCFSFYVFLFEKYNDEDFLEHYLCKDLIKPVEKLLKDNFDKTSLDKVDISLHFYDANERDMVFRRKDNINLADVRKMLITLKVFCQIKGEKISKQVMVNNTNKFIKDLKKLDTSIDWVSIGYDLKQGGTFSADWLGEDEIVEVKYESDY